MYPWGNERRFNSWSDTARRLYGSRLQKITVNAGFTCPNRDGAVSHGGCTFCNNQGFNPPYCDPEKPIKQQIDEGLSFVKKRYPRASRFVAYFQAYSNTYAPLDRLKRVYGEALLHPCISGLVIGTRPDCIDSGKLDYISGLAGKYYVRIEYGVESCYDETLLRINRGHSFADSVRAIKMTSERGIHTGIHLILGLPGESRQQMLEQVGIINKLPVNSVKFHQLQIVRDTSMSIEYERDPEKFQLFSLDEYTSFIVEIAERLRPDIAIDRFAGEIPPRLIIGKRWGNIRYDRVLGIIEKKMVEMDTWQGRRCK